MPGFFTHYLFGMSLYKKISETTVYPQSPNTIQPLKQVIQTYPESYLLGLQGPDFFFFYVPYLLQQKVNIASTMHTAKANLFFRNCLNELEKESDLQKREIILAFVGGYICHYGMDYTAHPYVYAKTNYVKNQKSSLKSSGEHMDFESTIDYYMLKRIKGTDHLKKKSLFPYKYFSSQVIAEFLSKIIRKTYHTTIKPASIHRAIFTFHVEARFVDDQTGRKKTLFYNMEQFILHYPYFSTMMLPKEKNLSPDDEITTLNLNHHPWKSPWEADTVRYDSFLDLWNKAFLDTKEHLVYYAEYADLLLQSRITTFQKQNLLNSLQNKCFHSGLSSLD
ncbi:zinc dependent phospholipase C family protein [Anaeromicropila populeti]|uniref:Zinc dependent phospholipase C n=1 Tax=Anaeromicropila populeti TaxID=37658 RepID=A0A1I6JR25_9FIRM|nr:zinc dependent phospholipase C family protein [Anaeromicropila populeti]SFR81378.1 Zinc dependent phospholipase C [Anaeromicropila populeti]